MYSNHPTTPLFQPILIPPGDPESKFRQIFSALSDLDRRILSLSDDVDRRVRNIYEYIENQNREKQSEYKNTIISQCSSLLKELNKLKSDFNSFSSTLQRKPITTRGTSPPTPQQKTEKAEFFAKNEQNSVEEGSGIIGEIRSFKGSSGVGTPRSELSKQVSQHKSIDEDLLSSIRPSSQREDEDFHIIYEPKIGGQIFHEIIKELDQNNN